MPSCLKANIAQEVALARVFVLIEKDCKYTVLPRITYNHMGVIQPDVL